MKFKSRISELQSPYRFKLFYDRKEMQNHVSCSAVKQFSAAQHLAYLVCKEDFFYLITIPSCDLKDF